MCEVAADLSVDWRTTLSVDNVAAWCCGLVVFYIWIHKASQ